jgi:hypothetical protein
MESNEAKGEPMVCAPHILQDNCGKSEISNYSNRMYRSKYCSTLEQDLTVSFWRHIIPIFRSSK